MEEILNFYELKNLTISNKDLIRILAFLQRKEIRDKSDKDKKTFLLKKYPENVVLEAFDIYYMLRNYESNEKTTNDPNIKELLTYFLILSLSGISSLAMNYVIDMNRTKKITLFFETHLEKLTNYNKDLSKDYIKQIKEQLSEFASNNELNSKLNHKLEYSESDNQIFLIKKSKEIETEPIKLEMNELNKKLKEIIMKVENNEILLKQEIFNEIDTRIMKNNADLIYKINYNQDQAIKMLNLKLEIGNIKQNNIRESENTNFNSLEKYLNLLHDDDKENVKKLILDLFKEIIYKINNDNLSYYEIILPKSSLRSYVDEDLINFLIEIGFNSNDVSNDYLTIKKDKLANLEYLIK